MNIICSYCYSIVSMNECNKCDKYDYTIRYHCSDCHKSSLQKSCNTSNNTSKKTHHQPLDIIQGSCNIHKPHIYLQPLGTYITPYGRKLLPCKR